jgi:uncharacterized protein
MIRRLKIRDDWLQFDTESLRLYPDNVIPKAAPQFQHPFRGGTPLPRMLVLNVTHKCNLACEYCFVRNYYPEQLKRMSFDTAVRALTYMDRKQGGAISFFGGEPLLEWGLIRQLTPVIRLAWPQAHLHITTNGVLLDAEKCRWLDAHGFSLIVSVDGPPELHDAVRPLAGGAGSYEKVSAALQILARFPGLASRTTLRGTFTAASIMLKERVEHLNQYVTAGCANGVSVEPASLSEACSQTLPPEFIFDKKHLRALHDEYGRLADWMLSEYGHGRNPKFMHFCKMGGRILQRQQMCADCGAAWGYAAISPNGDIMACHREGQVIGHVDTGISESARAQWLDNRYYIHGKCPTCWARNVCGGGCRKDALDSYNDINRQNPVGCFIRKLWFTNSIWLISRLGYERAAKLWGVQLSSGKRAVLAISSARSCRLKPLPKPEIPSNMPS